jgi:hypothetical protein
LSQIQTHSLLLRRTLGDATNRFDPNQATISVKSLVKTIGPPKGGPPNGSPDQKKRESDTVCAGRRHSPPDIEPGMATIKQRAPAVFDASRQQLPTTQSHDQDRHPPSSPIRENLYRQ